MRFSACGQGLIRRLGADSAESEGVRTSKAVLFRQALTVRRIKAFGQVKLYFFQLHPGNAAGRNIVSGGNISGAPGPGYFRQPGLSYGHPRAAILFNSPAGRIMLSACAG